MDTILNEKFYLAIFNFNIASLRYFFFLLLASFNTLNILPVCECTHLVKNKIKTVYSMVEVVVHLRFEHLK
jgi:hypothetical protein